MCRAQEGVGEEVRDARKQQLLGGGGTHLRPTCAAWTESKKTNDSVQVDTRVLETEDRQQGEKEAL